MSYAVIIVRGAPFPADALRAAISGIVRHLHSPTWALIGTPLSAVEIGGKDELEDPSHGAPSGNGSGNPESICRARRSLRPSETDKVDAQQLC
jgi:hypothetical protein